MKQFLFYYIYFLGIYDIEYKFANGPNDDLFSLASIGTNFNEILIQIKTFSFENGVCKMVSMFRPQYVDKNCCLSGIVEVYRLVRKIGLAMKALCE